MVLFHYAPTPTRGYTTTIFGRRALCLGSLKLPASTSTIGERETASKPERVYPYILRYRKIPEKLEPYTIFFRKARIM